MHLATPATSTTAPAVPDPERSPRSPRHRNSTHRYLTLPGIAAQVVVAAAFGGAYALGAVLDRPTAADPLAGQTVFQPIPIPREHALVVTPLYNRPDFVTDEELADVLQKIRPKFAREHLKPNFVEHALRVWGVDATFADPAVLSGAEMRDLLTDTARFRASWGAETRPLLEDLPTGIAVRWGREPGASVHHDHTLAGLTEGGVTRDTPVFGPAHRNTTLSDVIEQAARDFQLDEKEAEWTAMAFSLWLPPTRQWIGGDGRHYSFDLIASRLLRGQKELGVCSGTHRVYSLAVLLRVDDQFDILSDATRADVLKYLAEVRDDISTSQFDDGHWPTNWPDGADAVQHPVNDELYKQVIATGHHLEWLAIAPHELHPSDESIRKAAAWVIRTTRSQSETDILEKYTFYSHVGNALALWRSTRPLEFWRKWEADHPSAGAPTTVPAAAPTNAPATGAAH